MSKVGEKVGRKQVDRYGDNVNTEALPGDTWRIRHDSIKTTVASLCRYAGVSNTVEVYGLFAHLIPQDPLSRIDSARSRQSMIPDMKLELFNRLEGRVQSHLAEYKIISCGDSRYDRKKWTENRAVDQRAGQLQAEYLRKARAADRLGGTDEGDIGPVEQRLSQFPPIMGLVFGAFNEASEEVHALVDTLAASRVQSQSLRQGRGGSEQELAQVTGQIRRVLSTSLVKANAS